MSRPHSPVFFAVPVGEVLMDRTAMECAEDARTTSEHARQASERAVEAAGGGHHDLWLRHLQQCLTRADQSVCMAFDSVDAMMGGAVGSALMDATDASSLSADEMRAAASALRWAADALLHMATARGVGEGAEDSNVEDTNVG